MPVFVEWEWKERTKSFLVIFHFCDDFSKPNLRMRKYVKGELFTIPSSEILEPKEAWMTWASSHQELALLSDILSYANIVNGLKESEKRSLRTRLGGAEEVKLEGDGEHHTFALDKIVKDKKIVFYIECRKPIHKMHVLHCCVELCPEYIDYLKEILKPYLKKIDDITLN